jgi:glycosyltransferase involved in cell wall biosynthesis
MITFNEEQNLPRTLGSLRWVDEIVIVDSGSTDRTEEIAKSYGACFSRNLDFRGHGEQKNIALTSCHGDWILLLDADEVVTPELQDEIKNVLRYPEFDAYWIPRLNLFLNRWMRHGGLYPDRKLRLFRNGAALMEEGCGPHATPLFRGPTGRLKHHFLHYAYPDLTNYFRHMNSYSSEIARIISASERRVFPASLFVKSFVNPLLDWLRNYIILGGFLDGREGLLFHANHALYVHWKYIKAYLLLKQGVAAAPGNVQPFSQS